MMFSLDFFFTSHTSSQEQHCFYFHFSIGSLIIKKDRIVRDKNIPGLLLGKSKIIEAGMT